MANIAFQDDAENAGGGKEVVWKLPHVTITLTQTDTSDEFAFVQVRAQLQAIYGDSSG